MNYIILSAGAIAIQVFVAIFAYGFSRDVALSKPHPLRHALRTAVRLTQRITLWSLVVLGLLYSAALWVEHNGVRQPVGTILILLVLSTTIGAARGFSHKNRPPAQRLKCH